MSPKDWKKETERRSENRDYFRNVCLTKFDRAEVADLLRVLTEDLGKMTDDKLFLIAAEDVRKLVAFSLLGMSDLNVSAADNALMAHIMGKLK